MGKKNKGQTFIKPEQRYPDFLELLETSNPGGMEDDEEFTGFLDSQSIRLMDSLRRTLDALAQKNNDLSLQIAAHKRFKTGNLDGSVKQAVEVGEQLRFYKKVFQQGVRYNRERREEEIAKAKATIAVDKVEAPTPPKED